MNFLDLNDVAEDSTAISMPANSERLFSAKVPCVAGYFLSASVDNADVDIYAKANAGDSWTDIQATPFDLGPYDPQNRIFYFRITTALAAVPADEIVSFLISR